MQIQIVNPIEYEGWNELVRSNRSCTFFHSANWAKVLSESYRYTPHYFLIVRNGKLETLVPLMEVNSSITGKKAVSLPFTDYCETIVDNNTSFDELMASLIEHGKKSGWKSIELRTVLPFPADTPPSLTFSGHTIDLTAREEELFLSLRDTTRRNIKKAFKEGVQFTIDGSREALREFCRLNCITRKDHGLPPQPRYFFEKINEHILTKNLGTIILAGRNGVTVAGAVFFHFGETAFYKYGASDKRYQHLRANNLIMWEAIRWYRGKGCTGFSFGRTEPENEGLLQFKRGWGAKESLLNYYKYDLTKNAFVRDSSKLHGWYNKVFTRMPVPMLKFAGSLLYRHMG